jgi:hypothetical protein
VSVGCHALLLVALLSARIDPPDVPVVAPMAVALVAPPPPPPPKVLPPKTPKPVPAPPAAAKAPIKSPAKSRPRSHLKPTPKPPPDVEPLPASEVPTPQPVFGLGEAELAGATTAGSGAGGSGGGAGGGCNMVRLLQDALRKNPRILSAIARAHPDAVAAGKAIMVWNGDWIRNPGQDGKGLAGIRQAIAMEIAFAPEPCRADPVHGLVVISLDDGPGSVRLALGSRQWRWSDLVFAQSARPG